MKYEIWTKERYILEHMGNRNGFNKEHFLKKWEKISNGNNFILVRRDADDRLVMYSVDYINQVLNNGDIQKM